VEEIQTAELVLRLLLSGVLTHQWSCELSKDLSEGVIYRCIYFEQW